jgi:ubiquinone/menaquinone biosynthesis C-methylase UbiE
MSALKRYLQSLWTAAEDDYRRAFFRLVEPDPQAAFLDCGCDTGALTIEVAQHIGTQHVYGLDVVEERLAKARALGIDGRLGDLNTRFPFEDASLSVTMANQVIEHLHDTDTFIAETFRVLRPGGYALICTENLAATHNLFALLLGYQPFSLSNVSTLRSIGNPLALHRHATEGMLHVKSFQHMRVFAYQGLKEIVEAHGFVVERMVGTGYYPLPPALARLAGRVDPRHAAFLLLKARKS